MAGIHSSNPPEPKPARLSVLRADLQAGVEMAEFSQDEIRKMVKDAVRESTEDLVSAITAAVSQSVARTIKCSVEAEVVRAMDEYDHECVLDLEDDEIRALRKLSDIASSLGEHGDMRAGVAEMRDNHHFIKNFRKKVDKVGGAMLIIIASSIIGTVLIILGMGTKEYFKNGSGP
jgi:hypothetical protein